MVSLKTIRTAGLSLVTALAVGVSLGATAPAEAKEVKLGHLAPETDPRHSTMQSFGKKVEQATNGELTVTIFPSSQLGKERELFEQVKGGIAEFALVGGIVSNFKPAFAIYDMPFLWESMDQQILFMFSDYFQQWASEVRDEFDVEILAFLPRNPRIITTPKTVVDSVDDLQGLKMRVPNLKVSTDTFRAFGVEPTPMPASDMYMALKLGTIEGMENPVEVMYHWKMYEVSENLSLTAHQRSGFFLLANAPMMDALPEGQRQAIRNAGKEAAMTLKMHNERGAAELYQKLEAAGMKIVYEPDVSGFKDAAASVHENYMDQFGREAYEAVKNNTFATN